MEISLLFNGFVLLACALVPSEVFDSVPGFDYESSCMEVTSGDGAVLGEDYENGVAVEEEEVVEQQSVPKESPTSIFDLLDNSPADIESEEVTADQTGVSDFPSLVPTPAPDVDDAGSPAIPIIDITWPPTGSPTMITTVKITFGPTSAPSTLPSDMPSDSPSNLPSMVPSDTPTLSPSSTPSDIPSDLPSSIPTSEPSPNPTGSPSVAPSQAPSAIATVIIPFVPAPTSDQRDVVGSLESDMPSDVPSDKPSSIPTAERLPPTQAPSAIATVIIPFVPAQTSDQRDVVGSFESDMPSDVPSDKPSSGLTTEPLAPTQAPSAIATVIIPFVPAPTSDQRDVVSSLESDMPSDVPSSLPTAELLAPTQAPSAIVTVFIPFVQTSQGTELDTEGTLASSIPSDVPSDGPSSAPSDTPSLSPTITPSQFPTAITTVVIPLVQAPTSSERDVVESTEEPDIDITGSDLPSISPITVDQSIESTGPNMESSAASLPNMVQKFINSDVPSDMPSQMPSFYPSSVPSDFPSAMPSFLSSDMPSDMPSRGQNGADFGSDSPSSVPEHDSMVKDILPSDFPSLSPTSTDLATTKFMDAEHIAIFEEICANNFLREYLPWVQSADYKAISCAVVSQKETIGTRRGLQTAEHQAQITYRTSGIDILILVFGVVDLPPGVSFQSIVLKTFANFKSEFQDDLSEASDFFVSSESTDETTAAVTGETNDSTKGNNILGATTVWYIVAAALIAGGFLALSISFFILSRREDETYPRGSGSVKDDGSSNHLSVKISEDEMLPPTPVGLDAMRPPPLHMADSEENAAENYEDDSSTSGSKSEPSLTVLKGPISLQTNSFDLIVGKYSPHAGKREIPQPPPSPQLSLVAEEPHVRIDRMLPDIESQDQSTGDSPIFGESTDFDLLNFGWRRMFNFGKRKRSFDVPPLQQQRDTGLSPDHRRTESSDLAGWTQNSLKKDSEFDHVLTDLDKLAKKKSSASTPKYDNTSSKPLDWQ